jgi:acyl carrier protein
LAAHAFPNREAYACAVEYTDVRAVVCQLLQDLASTEGLKDEDPLVDAGIDSLSSLALRTGIMKAFCTPLPATFVFDYPTLGEITNHL